MHRAKELAGVDGGHGWIPAEAPQDSGSPRQSLAAVLQPKEEVARIHQHTVSSLSGPCP